MAYGEAGAVCPVLAERLDRSRYFRADCSPWAIFADIAPASPVERLRGSFPALSAVARVHGAATVAEAYELAPLIRQAETAAPGDLRVVNSGTIDRYVNLWGKKPMRYLGNSYVHPVVPSGAANQLPAVRLRQARTPKIIVAGMTRTPECIADLPGTLLPAKSTTVIESDADLCWLLGILNSRLIAFYFLSVYGGDRLHGGYLRIGPPQLRTFRYPSTTRPTIVIVRWRNAFVGFSRSGSAAPRTGAGSRGPDRRACLPGIRPDRCRTARGRAVSRAVARSRRAARTDVRG